jgi:hypothetical protein
MVHFHVKYWPLLLPFGLVFVWLMLRSYRQLMRRLDDDGLLRENVYNPMLLLFVMPVLGTLALVWLFSHAHDTVYAPGFSAERFAAVAVGSAANQLESQLGKPFATECYTPNTPPDTSAICSLFYTFSPENHHHYRYIVLTRADTVLDKLHDFHYVNTLPQRGRPRLPATQ